VRNIDTLYFVNAIAGRNYAGRPEVVDPNYAINSGNVGYANETDRLAHKNKLVLATAMAELQTGYGGRPSPRVMSHVYYGNTVTGAIESAIADVRADTVVLGSSGIGQKRGLGSVTSWVITNSQCNVVVVPPAYLDHKGMRHLHVREGPYQKEKKNHSVFGGERDVAFFSSP
jgi:nucleotide-binding universal stress UspA family protein